MSHEDVPDFSPLAGEYARSRPRYPKELFDHLAGLLDRRQLAWDAATGNGQAAAGLVSHFERVLATDVSAEQIALAPRHPRIEYRLGRSEEIDLEDGSVDLVSVAAAIHWFDLERFARLLRRVVRRGGVVAAWSYHVGRCSPPVGAILGRLYKEVLQPYFAAGARLVDDDYAALELPGRPLAAPRFAAVVEWDLGDLRGFVRSWSGARAYLERHGEDPLARVDDELATAWGAAGRRRELRFPLALRLARL